MAEQLDPDMLRGSIDLLVLAVLLDGKKYGYLIQQELRQASGQMVRLQAGTLYPLLHRLEAAGLICGQGEESTGRRRKWYTLTGKGRRRLEKQARQWNRLADCMHVLLRPILEGAG